MRKKRLDKGFTLIELLVTISILTILTFVGIGRYKDFNEREKLRQAVRDVKMALQEAQKRAQAGEMNETACTGLVFQGWAMEWVSSSAYKIGGKCGGAFTGYFNVKEFNLPEDITFQAYFGYIRFHPFGAGVEFPTTITLVGAGGQTATVTVGAGGEITL